MKEYSRRQFATNIAAAGLAAGTTAGAAAGQSSTPTAPATVTESLNGRWRFRLDPDGDGESRGWHNTTGQGWTDVTVPHTWQVDPPSAEYTGIAWYRRSFDAPADWRGRTVRAEFEAVYHSATVWVNGTRVGAHERKGYTAFCLDISSAVRYGERNTIAVKVDNSFRDDMLPRSASYDWAPDGGITRSVQLLVSPVVFIETVEVEADPDEGHSEASIRIRVAVRNASGDAVSIRLACEVAEEDTGLRVLQAGSGTALLAPGSRKEIDLPDATLRNPRLWHFDHPNLYRLAATLEQDGAPLDRASTRFGIRSIEVKDGAFFLNGERVRLMGVERMAGSNPNFGMAEPASWIAHDHDDMKELNCVFTRVHWQQDRRVLDYCDRNGMLIQVEVPSWGPKTFAGMGAEPAPEIMRNGLEQLREMIRRDRNHPCVFSWGLCNEVNGQNPAAQKFVRRMSQEARRLDSSRPLTYASNSLQRTPERDVAGELDFIMWNEYYESWMGGDVAAMERNLEAIHQAFPDKPIVISEYGYCECRPSHSGGDVKRIDILHEHTRIFRQFDYVAGAIFFNYNDYRTHIGDKGVGALKQRVHGVVDLLGDRKPSFEDLRRASSPVEQIRVARDAGGLDVTVAARERLPSYTLEGYRLRWTVYGFGGLPMEMGEADLPKLKPGDKTTVPVRFQEKAPRRIRIDVMRPTGFSALTAYWEA